MDGSEETAGAPPHLTTDAQSAPAAALLSPQSDGGDASTYKSPRRRSNTGASRAGSIRSFRPFRPSAEHSRAETAETASVSTPMVLNASGMADEFVYASRRRNTDFHRLFAEIPEDELLIEDYSCALSETILLHGRMYLSEQHCCFYSNVLGYIRDLVVPFSRIRAVERRNIALWIPNSLEITVADGTRYFFASFISREDTLQLFLRLWRRTQALEALAAPDSDPGGSLAASSSAAAGSDGARGSASSPGSSGLLSDPVAAVIEAPASAPLSSPTSPVWPANPSAFGGTLVPGAMAAETLQRPDLSRAAEGTLGGDAAPHVSGDGFASQRLDPDRGYLTLGHQPASGPLRHSLTQARVHAHSRHATRTSSSATLRRRSPLDSSDSQPLSRSGSSLADGGSDGDAAFELPSQSGAPCGCYEAFMGESGAQQVVDATIEGEHATLAWLWEHILGPSVSAPEGADASRLPRGSHTSFLVGERLYGKVDEGSWVDENNRPIPWRQGRAGMDRRSTFIMPVNAPIGPKQADVNAVQRVRHFGSSAICMEQRTSSPNVPYGDAFEVVVQTVFTQVAPAKLRMVVAGRIQWHRSVFMASSMIVARTTATLRTHYSQFAAFLQRQCRDGAFSRPQSRQTASPLSAAPESPPLPPAPPDGGDVGGAPSVPSSRFALFLSFAARLVSLVVAAFASVYALFAHGTTRRRIGRLFYFGGRYLAAMLLVVWILVMIANLRMMRRLNQAVRFMSDLEESILQVQLSDNPAPPPPLRV